MSWASKLVAYALFPVCFAGNLALAWAALAHGVPPSFAMLAGSCAASACFIAERVAPFARTWRSGHGDVPTDLAHVVLSQGVGSFVAGLVVQAVPVVVAVWPARWPLVAQVALAFVVSELVQYAWHRACHAFAPLWRLHATHHSSSRMMWLASARFHPIEVVVEYVLVYGALVALGASVTVVVFVSVATVTLSLFQHANLDVRLGAFSWIIAAPELHRWHHAADPAMQRANYGAILIVWDVVFGTRRAPDAPTALEVGLAGFPQTYVGQLLAPIRWKP